MSDTYGNQDNNRDPVREGDATAKADRIVSGARARGVTSAFTSTDFDDETLRTKEKLASVVAAVMVLGPLFFGWSGIGR